MFAKITFVAILAVASAQYHGHGYSHGHGHAVSSQNVVLHQTHGHVQHAPVIAHHAPLIAHHAPVIAHHVPVVSHHAPLVHHQPTHYSGHHEEHHAPAHYAFDYSVNDPHTGDIKSQHETREGDHTKGFYSFHEADGTIRRVDYTVDGHSGFNAVVHREGHAAHAAPVHHQPIHHAHH